eukprot:COSAG01_NODE_2491_length_7583_cov_32.473944_3_plen_65_part_00
MRSLVKRLGMGLPNNLLPEFPAITGSLIDRSIDLLLILSEMNKVEIWHGSRMVEFSYNVIDTAS